MEQLYRCHTLLEKGFLVSEKASMPGVNGSFLYADDDSFCSL